jgi:hypothetical protein
MQRFRMLIRNRSTANHPQGHLKFKSLRAWELQRLNHLEIHAGAHCLKRICADHSPRITPNTLTLRDPTSEGHSFKDKIHNRIPFYI